MQAFRFKLLLTGSIILFFTAMAMPVHAQKKKAAPKPGKKTTKAEATKKEAPKAAKPAPKPAAAPKVTPTAGSATPAKNDKHRLKLIAIEEKVDSLKERIFRSKAQLMLLQQSLLQGAISTAKLTIHHQNSMGSSFYLLSASYFLDGNPIFTKSDYNGNLNGKKNILLYQGSIQPTTHTLTIELEYRGNGFGIFSYLNKYRFNIKSSHTFKAEEGKSVEIQVEAYEKGRLTVKLQDRPDIRYKMKIRKVTVKKKQLQKSVDGK